MALHRLQLHPGLCAVHVVIMHVGKLVSSLLSLPSYKASINSYGIQLSID